MSERLSDLWWALQWNLYWRWVKDREDRFVPKQIVAVPSGISINYVSVSHQPDKPKNTLQLPVVGIVLGDSTLWGHTGSGRPLREPLIQFLVDHNGWLTPQHEVDGYYALRVDYD